MKSRLFSAFIAGALFTGLSAAEPLIGLTSTGTLVQFDSASPADITAFASVSGLSGGETLLAIDIRPASGTLYAVSSTGKVYAVDPDTGVAAFVTTSLAAFSGNKFDIDFNPAVDRLRVVSDLDQNMRLNPLTDSALVDTTLAYTSGDFNFGVNPTVTAIAYANNFLSTSEAYLYGIDSAQDAFVHLPVPNNGQMTTVGSLGVDAVDAVLDISGVTGKAYAAMSTTAGGASSLYTWTVFADAATLLGPIGPGLALIGIAAPVGGVYLPAGEPLFALTPDNSLLLLDSAAPQTVTATVPLSGLLSGENLLAMDVRPATGRLYAVGDLGTLYLVNPLTGSLVAKGPISPGWSGTNIDIDFNPVADRIRLVSGDTDNLRINPDTVAVTVDTATAYAPGDLSELYTPQIAAIAYTNSYAGAATTVLYDLDLARLALVLQNPANGGILNTVGNFANLAAGPDTGFDISGVSTIDYASFTSGPLNRAGLYAIDLVSGKAALIGPIGNGTAVRDIAVAGKLKHSCDQDGDFMVSLAELLRVIQFYNSFGYGCAVSPGDTEDGYVPGPGSGTSCAPHDSDYNTQDWVISLAELLRAIQFYNSLGYHPCPGQGTEDGYCPGAA